MVETRFKKTEIGEFPEDWELKDLLSLVAADGLVRGPFGGALKKECFVPKGYKVYEQRNAIYRSALIGTYYIDSEKYRELLRFAVCAGDLIVSCSGTIGAIFEIPSHAELGIINQALLKIKLSRERYSQSYFLHVFRSPGFQARIKDNTHGGAMPNLVGMSVFRQTEIPLPPTKSEQEAIAKALSDADALIESLERLIAKKKQIKQGAMQTLLTGKIRLPGFETTGWKKTEFGEIPSDWEVASLGALGTVDAKNLGLDTPPGYQFNYISLECVTEGRLEGFSETVFHEAPSRARRKLRDNDILISTVRPNLMAHLWFRKKSATWICSTGFSVLSVYDDVEPGYVYPHLFSSTINVQIQRLIAGSNYPAISSNDVKKLIVPIPPSKAEQSAIANSLSSMDEELDHLASKLIKAKQVKQGMMQQLLTGRIRLI